jgi:serine/threonine kinase 38
VKQNKNLLNRTFCIKKQNLIEKCNKIPNFIFEFRIYIRYRRKKISVRDFDPLNIIGRGAFGEVRICRLKETGEIVAMKKMKKSEMLYKN